MAATEQVELPMPVGTRIVSHPFDHYGEVGPNSSPTICEVRLDEPLKHTDRVWSQWSEIQAEGEYEIEQAQGFVDLAERELQYAATAAANANDRLRAARETLRLERKKLRETEARFA